MIKKLKTCLSKIDHASQRFKNVIQRISQRLGVVKELCNISKDEMVGEVSNFVVNLRRHTCGKVKGVVSDVEQ